MANLNSVKSVVSGVELPSSHAIVPLWSHQEAMLKFALSRPKTMIYAGMSTGKTYFALRYAEAVNGLTLVISPAAPAPNFINDFSNAFPDSDLPIIHLNQSKEKNMKTLDSLRGSKAIVVASYNMAYTLPISRYYFKTVIADEAHRLGRHNGNWSLKLTAECKGIPHKVAMSGTPFHDGTHKIYAQERWLHPVYPPNPRAHPHSQTFGSYEMFQSVYCVTKYLRGIPVPVIVGYKNLDGLTAKLDPFTLVIPKDEVLADLPPLTVQRHVIELTKKTRDQYDEISDGAILRVGEQVVYAPHVLTRLTRSQQLITSGFLTSETGDAIHFDIKTRQDMLLNLLEEIGDEPVVIFHRFKGDIPVIESVIRKYDDKASISHLNGTVNTFEGWRTGETKYLIANVQSGSEGTRMERSRHIIVWSADFSLKNLDQMVSRIHRRGTTWDKCFIHVIQAKGTVDEWIYKTLQAKTKDVDKVGALLNESPT